MAVTVLDMVNNQWYVQRADGELEACHNRATANTLRQRYDREEEEKEARDHRDIFSSQAQLALQEVV